MRKISFMVLIYIKKGWEDTRPSDDPYWSIWMLHYPYLLLAGNIYIRTGPI